MIGFTIFMVILVGGRLWGLIDQVKHLETENEAQLLTNCELHQKNVEMMSRLAAFQLQNIELAKRVNDLYEINDLQRDVNRSLGMLR